MWEDINIMCAVSYTHLDVYKRQEVHLLGEGEGQVEDVLGCSIGFLLQYVQIFSKKIKL